MLVLVLALVLFVGTGDDIGVVAVEAVVCCVFFCQNSTFPLCANLNCPDFQYCKTLKAYNIFTNY